MAGKCKPGQYKVNYSYRSNKRNITLVTEDLVIYLVDFTNIRLNTYRNFNFSLVKGNKNLSNYPVSLTCQYVNQLKLPLLYIL